MGVSDSGGILTRALDAVASAVFVLSGELKVVFVNRVGSEMVARGAASGKRLGDRLGCDNALRGPQGCTTSPFCRKCVVRRMVLEALRRVKTVKARVIFKRFEEGVLRPVPVIVSASPFRSRGKTLCLLTLDDMTGLAELQSLLPICANCKKIRTEDNYWEQIEVYINKHLADIKFTHGFCPACVKKLYPELIKEAGFKA
ncbi:MAG: hypothetical protein HY952_08410 [Elusimicrobia bacterium]|nr:hypothetical protein [Elusimicrobiota bacterium]